LIEIFEFKSRTPRWIIIILDLWISLFGLVFAYIIRFDLISSKTNIYNEFSKLQESLLIFFLIKFFVFYFFKIHKGLVRHTSNEDLKRIFYALCTCFLLFIIIGIIRYNFFAREFLFPTSVLIVEFITSLLILVGIRFIIKLYYIKTIQIKDLEKLENILIYGAGISGLITKKTIQNDPRNNQKIIGFIDDDFKLDGTRIEGVNTYASSELANLCKEFKVKTVVIAIQNPNLNNQKKIIDTCLNLNVKIQKVPNPKSWINGEFSAKQLTKIKIEDLLGRNSIILEKDKVKFELNQKVILITGAAGSIGSGLTEQIALFNPKLLILLDQAESPLFDLQFTLINEFPELKFELVIGDVSNEIRMNNLFKTYKPQLVFHAAAYKHVPMMEMNPSEAVVTNIIGTKIIADLSDNFKVQKFVMISTDKAVNPTNVMGASKRIAEIYIENKNKASETNYITTRFGNVLGSNGSVIPLFQKQIEKGGPITITDERITRYFMTIFEACQLVLEAGAMGKGGEIFIFEMGESVKIIELAKKMIALSGLELGRDIDIKIIGLRPGEKLYEELLSHEENTIKTHHSKILIAKNRGTSLEQIKNIEELIALIPLQDNQQIVKKMKGIVLEYISKNSIYEALD
jgi:FlaA1/EpsC-like NDP-sugar epimerase